MQVRQILRQQLAQGGCDGLFNNEIDCHCLLTKNLCECETMSGYCETGVYPPTIYKKFTNDILVSRDWVRKKLKEGRNA